MTERAKKLLLLYYKQSRKIRRVSGLPPLTFKAKKAGTLKDYRIYGNTAGGESVGDRTGNLFDGTFIHRSAIGAVVGDDDLYRRSIVVDISNFNNGDKITFSRETSAGNMFQMYQVSSPLKGGRLLNANVISGDSKTLLATITLDNISNYPYLMIFLNGTTTPITDEELLASKIMVNVGNTPLPYEPYGYKVPVTVSNGTDTLTTPIYLPEPIKMVGDEAEYIDYAEQKQHRVRKNLLPNAETSQTINGVTFTVNSDGSVTCNGTATAMAFFSWMSAGILPNNKRVFLTGCPSGGGASNYLLKMQIVGSPDALITDAGHGSITLFSQPIYPVLRIQAGYTCNNLTFYPMLRLASITDDTYEPYIKNTDLNVTLPALPVLPGTNTLTVGTEVQPSGVEIKGRIKAAGGD